MARNRDHAPCSTRSSPSRPIRSSRSRGKSSAPRVGRAAQRGRRRRVGAGGPADAEVDAPGVQRLEHGELLGDDERGVVGQHHAAGADLDRRRRRRRGGPSAPAATCWRPSACCGARRPRSGGSRAPRRAGRARSWRPAPRRDVRAGADDGEVEDRAARAPACAQQNRRGRRPRFRRRRARAGRGCAPARPSWGMNRVGVPSTSTGTAGARAPMRSAMRHADAAVADAVLARDDGAVAAASASIVVVERGAAADVPHRRRRCPRRRASSAAFSAASTSLPMASTHTRSPDGSVGGADPAGPDADADLVLADLAGLAPWVADGDRAAVGERHGVVQHLVQLLGARRRQDPHARARGRASPCRTRRGGWRRRGR